MKSVCILVLTYNHEHFIGKCLDSLLVQQTRHPYSIVIGEDNSTDNTRAICRGYASKYPDIIQLIERSKNIGEIENFMSTFKACDGEYIAFCEGDDFWVDTCKLQSQIDFLDQNPDTVIHFTECQYADERDNLMGKFSVGRGLEHKKNSFVEPNEIIESRLRPIHISSCMMRRSRVELPPSYSDTPILDTPFLFYNSTRGKVFFSSSSTTAYRKHTESITTKNTFSSTYVKALEKMFFRLDQELNYKFSSSIKTAIANRKILEIRSEMERKSWSIWLIVKLLFFVSISKSYTFSDWLWITRKSHEL